MESRIVQFKFTESAVVKSHFVDFLHYIDVCVQVYRHVSDMSDTCMPTSLRHMYEAQPSRKNLIHVWRDKSRNVSYMSETMTRDAHE